MGDARKVLLDGLDQITGEKVEGDVWRFVVWATESDEGRGPVRQAADPEVIRAIEKIHGQRLNVREEPRRAGDPPALVAGADRIRSLLAWHPRYDDLEFIVKTSLDWEQRRFY